MKRGNAIRIGLAIALLGMGIMGWAFLHGDNNEAKAIIIVGGVLFVIGVILFAVFFKEKE